MAKKDKKPRKTATPPLKSPHTQPAPSAHPSTSSKKPIPPPQKQASTEKPIPPPQKQASTEKPIPPPQKQATAEKPTPPPQKQASAKNPIPSNQRPSAVPESAHASGFWSGYGDRRLFSWRIGAVLLTAISQPLLSAPFNWWPWHWVAWLPFLWAVHQQGGKGRWFLGYLGGTASNFMIFYWVIQAQVEFGKIKYPVAVGLNWLLCSSLSFIWIFLAWGVPWLSQRYPRVWIYLVPAFLASMEYLLPQLFPYMQGVSHYQVVTIYQISSLIGIYGLTFLVLWCNCLIYDKFKRWQQERPIFAYDITLFVMILLSVLAYGRFRQFTYDQKVKTARRLKVAMLQSSLLPGDHYDRRKVEQLYKDMSTQAALRGADWIVWSEGEYKQLVSDVLIDANGDILQTKLSAGLSDLRTLSHKLNRPILVGTYGRLHQGKESNWTNAAIHVLPNGDVGQRYDKILLVPFGEYIPFERWIGPIMKRITHWRSRYAFGRKQVVQPLQGIPYSFLICYEAIYPTFVRESVRKGSRLLVNITYDAWFGRTTAPYQHMMLAASRSAELGVPLVRLATTGVSTTVDALGRMNKLSPLYQRQVVLQEIPLVYMPSLYLWIGDIFVWCCIAAVLFALLWGFRRPATEQPTA